MKKIKSQKGQALILIALAIVGLVGFSALTIDGGRVLSDRRHAQNAADTAALAAALAKIKATSNGNQLAIDAAMARAASNGYDNGAASDVEVHIPPISGPYTGNNQYIQVIIKSYVSTTFARVLGRTQVQNTVEAITRVQGSTSSGSFFNGAGMVSTKSSGRCFLLNGGAYVYMHDTGIYLNCDDPNAMFMNNNITLNMDSNGQIVGCYSYNGSPDFDPINCDANGGVSQVIDEEDFEDIPKSPNPPNCTGYLPLNPPPSGNVYSPGTYNNLNINSPSVFKPGLYCFTGSLNANSTISGQTGKVQFVMNDISLNLNGAPNTFDDFEMYTRNGSFTANGSATFSANRLRFYSTGNGNFTVNSAQASLSSGNAYLYLYGGEVVWNGNTQINLHAPPQDDAFGVGGLLIQYHWDNTHTLHLNGNSNVDLTGTILVPHSPVIFNGGSGFELHGQVIGYEFTANGGSTQDIYYLASENYSPPDDPTIEITK